MRCFAGFLTLFLLILIGKLQPLAVTAKLKKKDQTKRLVNGKKNAHISLIPNCKLLGNWKG